MVSLNPFRNADTHVFTDSAPYAPRWHIGYVLNNHNIERAPGDHIDLIWEFRPQWSTAERSQQQTGYLIRRGRGTMDDPFLYYDGSSFVTSAPVIQSNENAFRLTNWQQAGEETVVFQVAVTGEGSNDLSEYSPALVVTVGDSPNPVISQVDAEIDLSTDVIIGQRPIIYWRAPRQRSYRLRAFLGSFLLSDTGVIVSTNHKHTMRMIPGDYDDNVDVELVITDDYGRGFYDVKQFRMVYALLPRPTPTFGTATNAIRVENFRTPQDPVASNRLFDRVDVYRRFSAIHSDGGSMPASQFNLPYPDETLIAKDLTWVGFTDHSVRTGFEYQYRVIGYDDTGRNGLAHRETFNDSGWIG